MKNMRLPASLLCVAAILGFLPAASSAAWAATYYVDAAVGNDGNSGVDPSRAWRTVSKVNSKTLVPGDTVLFQRGQSWAETLTVHSGSSSASVNYGAYGVGPKPRLRNLRASGQSYVRVEGLEIETTSSDHTVWLTNAHHITLKSCHLYASASSGAWVVLRIEDNSSYNKVVQCHIEHRQTDRQNDTVNIYYNSSHNLLDGNTIRGATHSVIAMIGASDSYPEAENTFNIIRNNTIINAEARPLSITTRSNYNLIENNIIAGGKDTAYCSGGQTFKLVTTNNIVRRNVIRQSAANSAGGLSMIAYRYNSYPANHASNNRIYNNTFTELANDPIILGNYEPDMSRVEDNVLKNNAVFNNGADALTVKPYDSIRDNYFAGNILYQGGAAAILDIHRQLVSVAEVEASDPSHYFDNQQVDPGLDDNLVPATGSPAIDSGVDLTTVTSNSGSGTTFSVADASYFCDGWRLIPGDDISVGNTLARIASVDYANDQITVTSPIAWQVGQAVNLRYAGSGPDVGAFEYRQPAQALPPTNLRVMP